jgi:hypothetical protein
MKCPVCQRAVKEPGACEACLPFNIYYDPQDHLTAVRGEQCRKLILAHLNALKKMPFSQVGANGDVDEGLAHLVVKIEGQTLVMVPCLDSVARKSVLFLEVQEGIQQGHHRFRSKFRGYQ